MTRYCPNMTCKDNSILTDAQLKAEIEKCEYCSEKPCKTACPCDCSPADFIMAATMGAPSDFRRAGLREFPGRPQGPAGLLRRNVHLERVRLKRAGPLSQRAPASHP